MDIGARIRYLRKDVFKGSREDFAKRLGVASITIGRWERGERTPDVNDLGKLLSAFPDINPSWLLTGNGPVQTGQSQTNTNSGTVGDQGIINGRKVIGISEVTARPFYSDDVNEICALLEEYFSKAYRKKLLQELTETIAKGSL